MMRIKTVLRDNNILSFEPGSTQRIVATAEKNVDRVINLGSLLKVMGLPESGRIKMLEVLSSTSLHIWLGKEGDQHIIYLSKDKIPEEMATIGYQWQ